MAVPMTLCEKYLTEREQLYRLLEKLDDAIISLSSGNVASYSLGNRSCTYQNLDQLRQLRDDTESRIEQIEAILSHRSPRGQFTNTFLDPSITLPRKI